MAALLISSLAAGGWWLRSRNLASLLLALVLLSGVIACGGLGVATHVAPERFCDATPGLQLYAEADARSDGYALPLPGGERYFRQAVYDLIQGRVAFFEMEETSGAWQRYEFGSHRSAQCIARKRVDELLADLPLPPDQCVQARAVDTPTSRYVIDLQPAIVEGARELVLRERESAIVLAAYRQPQVLPPVVADLACPSHVRDQTAVSIGSLSALALADRWGERLTLAELDDKPARVDGDSEMRPPITELRWRLAADGRLDPRKCYLPGWMGKTEVHVLELKRGPLDMSARLDALSSTAGVVLVDVHAPDRAVIILATAEEPTIWHIHESGRTNIVGVLVRGQHGQAVLGVTPLTPILMSTDLHNPYTNCSADELEDIKQGVIAHYGIKSRQRDEPRLGKPPVRYSLGEPMPEGGQLFHNSFALEDFELRDTP